MDDGAEAELRESPAAPGVSEEHEDEQNSAAHEEEVGIGVPVIVDGVKMDGRFVEEAGQVAGGDAGKAEEEEEDGFVATGEGSVNEEADGEAREGKGRPGKEREEPVLRLREVVDAVDVGLDGPGEEARAVGGPERRGEHSDRGCHGERTEDATGAGGGDFFGGGEPAEQSHEGHGEAKDVEDVDAEEIGPGNPFIAESVFLEAEEEAESKDFYTAETGLFRDGIGGNSLLAEAFVDECHRDPCEEDEEWSGKSAAELRPVIEGGVAEVGSEPGIVAVGLEHEEAGEAAEPVDVGEARGGSGRHDRCGEIVADF